MPRGNYTIQRSCEECGKIFTPPTLVSKYCCPACSKRAYKKRQIAKEKEAIRMQNCGLTVYGGDNAPYLWLKTPDGLSSWKFFDKLLYEVKIVGTPGVGFGPSGEGYLRLTAFGDRDDTLEAMARLRKWLR